MENQISRETAHKAYTGNRTIRHELRVIFSCLTAIPFVVFAFIYFRIGTFGTALSCSLIALALILVMEGFITFRRMADHIEQLSYTMTLAEDGKAEGIQDAGETKELAIIANTFNRTLAKLEETAKELGVKAFQASTLNEIREIVSKSIQMEEVAKIILARAIKAVGSQAGYIAVKRDNYPILHVAAATSSISEKMPDRIELDVRETLAGLTVQDRSPILIEDIEEETQLKELNKPDIGLSRLLHLSIVAKETPVGVLVLGRDRTLPNFKEEDIQFLQTLLQQVAYSFENARLYESLQQSNRELEMALDSQMKTQDQLLVSARMAAFGELSVNIAHELNNPLTGILGYTDLLLGSSTDDTEKEKHLGEIRVQAIRARQIINNFLDFVSVKPGSKIQTDLNDLLKKALLLVQGRILECDIHLDLRLADKLPPVMADPVQMGEVFYNLVSNALNAMTGTFKVSHRSDEEGYRTKEKHLLLMIQTEERNGKVSVSFRDTGSGITPEDLPRIFEPFYSTQEKVSQVGQGLWVSRRIVKAHGGVIRVKSVLGKGSIFVVVLPLNGEELKIGNCLAL